VLRTLTSITGGLAAGLVLGARVPIVAPVRSDTMETRMASCVLASLLAAARGRSTATRAPSAAAEAAQRAPA